MSNSDPYDIRTGFDPGERVKATISAITRNTVFIDVGAKSEGIIERTELEQDGELTVSEGEEIEAYFTAYEDGAYLFTVRMQGGSDTRNEELLNAAQAEIPIEGKVVSERKGGFEIKVGNASGFCPFSQIDLFSAQDPEVYIGRSFTFLIIEYSDDNFVLSRRKFLEQERQEARKGLKEELAVGQLIEGTVRNVREFGAFVDIGGTEGLVPASELSWDRSLDPSEVVKPGDKLTVQVQSIDWEKDRIGLSLKKVGGDPWDTVQENYHVTKRYAGKVSKLMPFGAFVALEPGVEGLVHISKLGAGKRLNHAREVLEEGQELEVYIDNIDIDRQRISLVLENPQVGREMEVGEEGLKLTVGAEMQGRVEDIKHYGIFVKLSPTQTGLLHVSEIQFQGMVDRGRDMYKRFPPGSEITVTIKQISGDRISLGLPGNDDDSAEYRKDLAKDDKQEGLGDLGSLFDGLDL